MRAASLGVFLCAIVICLLQVHGFRVFKFWSERHECEGKTKPLWPFALSKYSGQSLETKGRVASNFQNIGHQCGRFGAHTKCYICEEIACGEHQDETCDMQIQGMDYSKLPKNIPTSTEVPWAVGSSSRYNFLEGTHVCVMLSGDHCIAPITDVTDFSNCVVRCWGWNKKGKVTQLSDSPFGLRYAFPKEGNPQGKILTYGGNGEAGFRDGPSELSQFNSPSAMAIDNDSNLLVADTGNNRIRKIEYTTGIVSTLAGTGVDGNADGDAITVAEFSKPEGVTLYYDDNNEMVVVIADTNNHRIRKLFRGVVSTLSGQKNMAPQQGYRDGSAVVSRFQFPRRVLADPESHEIYVSDSYNHLIRVVDPSGRSRTLAGATEPIVGEENSTACPPPCLQGVHGFQDGTLETARFHYPNGLAWGRNGSLILADAHRIRRIVFRGESVIQGVRSRNRVSTIAGGVIFGKADGEADEGTFNEPRGVAMAEDGRIYVADFVGNRIRRITRAHDVAQPITCSTRATAVIRPSGCSSYDPTVDATELKGTPLAGSIFYNKGMMLSENDVVSPDVSVQLDSNRGLGMSVGKRIMNCAGIPPYTDGITSNGLTLGPQLGTGSRGISAVEDTGILTEIKVSCPAGCGGSDTAAYGHDLYTDFSEVCTAAIHAGFATKEEGGVFAIVVRPGAQAYNASTRNGITSVAWSSRWHRSFSLRKWDKSIVQVETVAGRPTAFLADNRGSTGDIQPPQDALFDGVVDVAIKRGKSLRNDEFLFILDQNNHRVIRMSAVCSKICENGGECAAPETCVCAQGWTGEDCTTPILAIVRKSGKALIAERQFVNKTGRFVKHGVSKIDKDALDGIGDERSDTYLRGSSKELVWNQYVPCQYEEWCKETNGFDCAQAERNTTRMEVLHGSKHRYKTGFASYPGRCFPIEINTTMRSPFQKFDSYGRLQPHWRYPPLLPYERWGDNDWSSPNYGGASPPDRQVVYVEWRRISQGAYICANSGNCSMPDTCSCDTSNWLGFDCRIPICSNGYHEPTFTDAHAGGSLPGESSINLHPDGRSSWADRYPGQTGYRCSIRAYTSWENPFLLHEHPNYFSRYQGPSMNSTTGKLIVPGPQEDSVYVWDEELNFTRLYSLSPYLFDKTQKGWKRMGTWERPEEYKVADVGRWQKGACTIEFDRQCGIPEVSHLAISANANNIGGTFKLKFDGSVTTLNPAMTAKQMRDALQSMISIGTVWVSRSTFHVKYNADSPISCGTVTMEDHYGKHMDPESHCVRKPLLLGCDTTYDCHGMYWSVTFYNNIGNMPNALVSTGGPEFLEADRACDGEAETEDMGRPCSLTGGYQDGFPPRYIVGAATVTMVTLRDGVSSQYKARNSGTLEIARSVLDPEDAYRMRVSHTDEYTSGVGRWFQDGGSCVDMVVRGCLNNGTCVAPHVCQCSEGWTGERCDIPICSQKCQNNGNCTLPNVCTCEKGWGGHDCSYALCAQECNNNAKCTAPDVCTCIQFPNLWVDGRLGGGRPLFRDEFGDPQLTGWTGYDCSTPICTQHGKWKMNIDGTLFQPMTTESGWTVLNTAGTAFLGGDGYLLYGDEPSNNLMLQPPSYTEADINTAYLGSFIKRYEVDQDMLDDLSWFKRWTPSDGVIVRNQGKHFQTGCAEVQPLPADRLTDRYRTAEYFRIDAFRNPLGPGSGAGHQFRDGHYVLGWASTTEQNDTAWRRKDDENLCQVLEWEEGDYTLQNLHQPPYKEDDRRIRINYPNYIQLDVETFIVGPPMPGEGLYQCFNRGSCVSPDVCSCPDGWSGFDCKTPLCRFEQKDVFVSNGLVVSCLNGAICETKDTCTCIQVPSIMEYTFSEVKRFPLFPPYDPITGYIGTDCSIPKCVQGFWDHTCRGVTPGGEGCYRCANGGNCTAPDYCSCTPDWTGYDCSIPVCVAIADSKTVYDLLTVDVEKIVNFELNPCESDKLEDVPAEGERMYFDKSFWRFGSGWKMSHGNCSRPMQCTCTCFEENPQWIPWQDPLNRALPRGYGFGTTQICADGYEGNLRPNGFFMSCHIKIKGSPVNPGSAMPQFLPWDATGLLNVSHMKFDHDRFIAEADSVELFWPRLIEFKGSLVESYGIIMNSAITIFRDSCESAVRRGVCGEKFCRLPVPNLLHSANYTFTWIAFGSWGEPLGVSVPLPIETTGSQGYSQN
eukprot:g1477.t1